MTRRTMTFTDAQLTELRKAIVNGGFPILPLPENFPEWYQALDFDDKADAIGIATGVYLK